MGKRATAGTCLETLVRMAVPLLQEAERWCPRTGPGAKPDIPDWLMGTLIMVAVLKKKKSKSAQYRFLRQHRQELRRWLASSKFPSRSTYFRRYRRAYRLFRAAVQAQGQRAIAEGIADPAVVVVDKSLTHAQGPLWHKKYRQAKVVPQWLHGVDCESTWGYSEYEGWVQGYSYEVVISATPGTTIFPLLASADTASISEHQTFDSKIEELPKGTRYVDADSGYDNNEFGERTEYDSQGRRTGRRFLCPENPRNRKGRCPPQPACTVLGRQSRERRRQRRAFLESPGGRKLYALRGQTVEPFHDWFQTLFELDHKVWHRGLDNNRTQILAAIFAYQLLVRYNYRCGNENGQLRWIIDAL